MAYRQTTHLSQHHDGMHSPRSLRITPGLGITSDLKKEDERFLATQMQSIRMLLREYPDNVKTWKAEIERDTRASASTFAKYYVRITNEDGKTIIETPGMPIDTGQSHARKSAVKPFADIDYAAFIAQDGKPFLFALAPAKEPGKGNKGSIIQIALEMSHETAIVSDYRQKVSLVVIGGVIFSLLLGFLITKEGLNPLRELMHDVRDITPDKLQVRVGHREWPEEIGCFGQYLRQNACATRNIIYFHFPIFW